MPRRSKGPRLYLREGRVHRESGKPVPDVWAIRDGQVERSTGFGPDQFAQAQGALADYINAKRTVRPTPEVFNDGTPRDPASVYVAEVAALYLAEKAPKADDPSTIAARFEALLAFFIDDTLADIRRSRCEEYVAHRGTQPVKSYKDPVKAPRVSPEAARRELEDLSAAIGYFDGEHPLTRRPKVHLPPKKESPRDALTRDQAARLLMAARGYRRDPKTGKWKRLDGPTRAKRRNVRRLIRIGLRTGTRPGVIPKLLWLESPVQAWVDLDDGIIYRRGKRERDHRTKRRPLVRLPQKLWGDMRRWRAQDLRLQARRRAEQEERGEDATFTVSSVLHHAGGPLKGRMRTAFAACVADAGLNPDITPHWLRHTCATWLMEGDCSLWDAAAYTGMSQSTLEKHYGHHRPDHQKAARKALGGKRP